MPDVFECSNIWGKFSNRLSFNSQERFWSLFHQVVERSKISPKKNRLPIPRKMTIWSQNQSFCHWVRISSVTRFFRRLRRRRRQSRSAPRSERTLLRGSNTGVNNWSEGPISKHPNISACNISRVLRKIAWKHSITSPRINDDCSSLIEVNTNDCFCDNNDKKKKLFDLNLFDRRRRANF